MQSDLEQSHHAHKLAHSMRVRRLSGRKPYREWSRNVGPCEHADADAQTSGYKCLLIDGGGAQGRGARLVRTFKLFPNKFPLPPRRTPLMRPSSCRNPL